MVDEFGSENAQSPNNSTAKDDEEGESERRRVLLNNQTIYIRAGQYSSMCQRTKNVTVHYRSFINQALWHLSVGEVKRNQSLKVRGRRATEIWQLAAAILYYVRIIACLERTRIGLSNTEESTNAA